MELVTACPRRLLRFFELFAATSRGLVLVLVLLVLVLLVLLAMLLVLGAPPAC
jgi:hypothetical protein